MSNNEDETREPRSGRRKSDRKLAAAGAGLNWLTVAILAVAVVVYLTHRGGA